MNYRIDINMLNIKGAFETNIVGSTATKACLCIPIEESGLYRGKKGIYLNLTAFAQAENPHGTTHLVKQSLSKSLRQQLGEAIKEMPIVGNLSPLEEMNSNNGNGYNTAPNESHALDIDDVPF